MNIYILFINNIINIYYLYINIYIYWVKYALMCVKLLDISFIYILYLYMANTNMPVNCQLLTFPMCSPLTFLKIVNIIVIITTKSVL